MPCRAIITVICCFIAISGIAQSKIKGCIIDKSTRQPLEGVFIRIKNTDQYQLTNDHGYFSLYSHNDSTEIEVSSIGYKKQNLSLRGVFNLVVSLEPDVIELQTLVIAPTYSASHFNSLAKIDFKTRPVKSAQEILRIVPGLFIAQHQGGGKAEQIFLRGFDIDHGTDISINVDGMPVNMVSHAHGQGYADLHFVIPELIKTIDYGKGPYYAENGNFTTAGYVNLQTIDRANKNRVQIEAGMFNTLRTLAIVNFTHNNSVRHNAYVAGEFLYADGPFKSPQHFNRINLFGKYTTKVSANQDLSISASAFNSAWNASGQIPQRAVRSGLIGRFGSIDSTEGGFTSRINGSAKLTTHLKHDAVLENLAYYSRYGFNLFSNFTFFLNDPINGDQIKQKEARDIFGYSGNFRRQSEWKGFHLTSSNGIGFRYDKTFQSELSHTLNRTSTLQEMQRGNIRELNAFTWLSEEIRKGNWYFELGGRIDYFHFDYQNSLNATEKNNSKTIVSPKINLQYTLNKSLQLYLKAGKGFHSNDTRVVTANHDAATVPAAYGMDVGLNWKPFRNLYINSGAWYLFLEQEFIYVGDEGVIEPGNKTRRYGLDFSARYQITKHLFTEIDLNLSHARDAESPKSMNRIPLAPNFTSTGSITYRALNGLNGSLRYRFISDRPANEDNSIIAKGYFITDLAVNYTRPNYEISVVAENLLNTKWNEAQFATTSRLRNEPSPITELHFTPGSPFALRAKFAVFF